MVAGLGDKDKALSSVHTNFEENAFGDIDIRTYAYQPDPYPMYRHIRANEPITYSPKFSNWRVSRYADTVAVLRDERFGFPKVGATLPPWRELMREQNEPSPQHWLRLHRKIAEMQGLWVLLRNPPDHTRLRGLVQPYFTTTAVRHWQPYLEQTADALIQARLAQGEMDVIHDFAGPLVSSVMAEVLSVPHADRAQVEQWSRDLLHFLDADMNAVNYQRMSQASVQLTEYFRERIDDQPAPPRDDLFSALLRAHASGKLS